MFFSIEGKRILVTGGARGIGGGSARHFCRQGANVVTFDVRDELGMELAKEATDAGPGQITYRHMDVSKVDEVRAGIEFAVEKLGGVDAVLTSHGGPRFSPAAETPESDWDWQLSVNAKGNGLVCQAVFPHMKERGGSIVFIAAGGALKDKPIGSASYSASKGAIISYARTIALEWGPHQIRANCVNPVVDSELSREMRAAMSEDERALLERQIGDSIPLGRYGDIETELAPVLQFLMSDASKFITSQILAVDGGLNPSR
jgi:2-hydroxycyclohexanecarboxyl-CoA dehydrogenase